MLELSTRQYLLSLLADDAWRLIFIELAGMTEIDRSPILRPHDDGRTAEDSPARTLEVLRALTLESLRDLRPKELRILLDAALDDLTLIEIGFETGLLPEEVSEDPAWKQGGLQAFHDLVMESESFYGYATANLYFGVRILAWRCFGPCWPPRISSSLRSDVSTNRRSFPIMQPPPLVLPSLEQPEAGDDLLNAAIENQRDDNHWSDALRFLDSLDPEVRSTEAPPLSGYSEAALYQEPAEYELWLRGLLPDAADEVKQRFEVISNGLTAWAQQRTDFYLGLQSTRFKAADMQWISPKEFDAQGAFLANPLTARFALADIYWLARLLRADVSSHASVNYAHNPWLSLLAFKADLDDQSNV